MSNIKAEKAFIQFFDAFSQALKEPASIDRLRQAIAAQEEANAKLAEAQAHHNYAETANIAAAKTLSDIKRAKIEAETAANAAKEEREKLRFAKEEHAAKIRADKEEHDKREAIIAGREEAIKTWEDNRQQKINEAQKIIDAAAKIKAKAEKARAAWHEEAV